jgi:hypothetical protein
MNKFFVYPHQIWREEVWTVKKWPLVKSQRNLRWLRWENQEEKKRTQFSKKKDNKGVEKNFKKGGKSFQSYTDEIGSDNDGEYENTDSNEEEKRQSLRRKSLRRSTLQSRKTVKDDERIYNEYSTHALFTREYLLMYIIYSSNLWAG